MMRFRRVLYGFNYKIVIVEQYRIQNNEIHRVPVVFLIVDYVVICNGFVGNL